MEYDIWITEKESGREMRIPWLPEHMGFQSGGARFASYDILDWGEVRKVNGRNVGAFKWESWLPGPLHTDLPFLRGSWQEPRRYQEIWSSWRVNGTPLRLLIPNTPINHDVQLADYQVEYEGAFGDYKYSIEFCDFKDIVITSTSTQKTNASTESKRPAAPAPQTYTIKDGDTLWGIAERFLGDGMKYQAVYTANKKVLDDEAARRGMGQGMGSRWIFTGTTISIPK